MLVVFSRVLSPLLTLSVLVERPATKWPGAFENVQLFITYPYLLPCVLAALVMLIGNSSRSRLMTYSMICALIRRLSWTFLGSRWGTQRRGHTSSSGED